MLTHLHGLGTLGASDVTNHQVVRPASQTRTSKSRHKHTSLSSAPPLIPTSVTARMLAWIHGVHAMHTRVLALTLQKYRTKGRSPALGLGLGRVLERIADLQGQARVLGV